MEKIVNKIYGEKGNRVDPKKIIGNVYEKAGTDDGLVYKTARKTMHDKEVADDAEDIVENVLGETDND